MSPILFSFIFNNYLSNYHITQIQRYSSHLNQQAPNTNFKASHLKTANLRLLHHFCDQRHNNNNNLLRNCNKSHVKPTCECQAWFLYDKFLPPLKYSESHITWHVFKFVEYINFISVITRQLKMKKTILIAAITTLFATTAHSTTIYSAEAVTVTIFGDAEVVTSNSIDKDKHTVISIDEADMGFQLDYALNEDLTLSGLVEFGTASGTATLANAWAGIGSAKLGILTIGKQATLYDDSGIGGDPLFGFSNFYSRDNVAEQVVKYKIDKEIFYAGAAYLINSESGQTDGTEGFDANIGVRAGDFEATVYYAAMTDATDFDTSNINLELHYQLNAIALAVAYAKTDSDEFGDTDTFALTAVYQLNNNTTIAAGWANIDSEPDSGLNNQYYINTSYALNNNVNIYAELGGNESDNHQLDYAVGVIVAF